MYVCVSCLCFLIVFFTVYKKYIVCTLCCVFLRVRLLFFVLYDFCCYKCVTLFLTSTSQKPEKGDSWNVTPSNFVPFGDFCAKTFSDFWKGPFRDPPYPNSRVGQKSAKKHVFFGFFRALFAKKRALGRLFTKQGVFDRFWCEKMARKP